MMLGPSPGIFVPAGTATESLRIFSGFATSGGMGSPGTSPGRVTGMNGRPGMPETPMPFPDWVLSGRAGREAPEAWSEPISGNLWPRPQTPPPRSAMRPCRKSSPRRSVAVLTGRRRNFSGDIAPAGPASSSAPELFPLSLRSGPERSDPDPSIKFCFFSPFSLH